jgi:hypothetical protein
VASLAGGDPSENLIHGRPLGKTTQLASQELLQRLPALVGTR